MIDWLKIIQFHKEIVKRSNDDFFAMPIEQQTENWSIIQRFAPASLAGPWVISTQQLSEGIRTQIIDDEISDLYIGFQTFKGKINSDGKWLTVQYPILFRRVQIEKISDAEFEIKPDTGKWDISNPFLKLLDEQNFASDTPIEDLVKQLIEDARNRQNQNNSLFQDEFYSGIRQQFPGLLRHTVNHQSHWTLQIPPVKSSPLTYNILRDYEEIERRLTANSNDIGGLKLLGFTQQGTVTEENFDLLPIIPLNESQHKAVNGILQRKPVTVVSGPPGCGKSQVVESLLLNAWAQGISVLFASQNNQAVNVIKERINKDTDNYPIIIRAGAGQEQNILETIGKILNIVPLEATQILSAMEADEKKRKELQEYLNKSIFQQVEESVNSAIQAHIRHDEIEKQKKIEIAEHLSVLKVLGYKNEVAKEFERTILLPFQNWITGIDDCKKRIRQNQTNKEAIEIDITLSIEVRDSALERIEIEKNSITNWEWVVDDTTPEHLQKWFSDFQNLLANPIENNLNDFRWENSFDEWKSEEDAKQWSNKSQNLIRNIQQFHTETSLQIKKLQTIESQYNTSVQKALVNNIPLNINNNSALVEWARTFSRYRTIPKSWKSNLPFSEGYKLEKQLNNLERTLVEFYPVSVWNAVGTLNNEGRNILSAIIEITLEFLATREEWLQLDAERNLLRSKLHSLVLSIQEQLPNTEVVISSFPKESEWTNFIQRIQKQIAIADEASIGWRKKSVYEQTILELQTISKEFETIGRSTPLKEKWALVRGFNFCSAIGELNRNPVTESVKNVRDFLYNNSLLELIDNWIIIRTEETKHFSKLALLDKVPTEQQLIQTWYNSKPSIIQFNKKNTQLPEQTDEIFAHLDECERWNESWKQFSDVRLPELTSQSYQFRDIALNKLQFAFDTLPNSITDYTVHPAIAPILQRIKLFDIEEIKRIFERYNSSNVKAEIERISARLTTLSFQIAKAKWCKRISPQAIHNALSELEHCYSQALTLPPSRYDLFRQAFSAIPIWITTANSPQSIPLIPELFDILVVDEATQCTLTTFLPLIYRAKCLAVIGDPEQLPSIPSISIKAEKALSEIFGIEPHLPTFSHTSNSVYKAAKSQLIEQKEVINLLEHYRSHPLIIGFVNQYIYDSRLKLRKIPAPNSRIPIASGVFGYNIAGICIRGDNDKSWKNEVEAEAIANQIQQWKDADQNIFPSFTVGVVTPFSAQVTLIKNKLNTLNISGIKIGTAHDFQGSERDIMIFSPVVSNGITPNAISWMSKPTNLVNVALTRAREALLIIGNLAKCREAHGTILSDMAEYVKKVTLLRKTSAAELELFSWLMLNNWESLKGGNLKIHEKIHDIEVDFLFEQQRLVIEVDGDQHLNQTAQDETRDNSLIANGYKVLRFSTAEIWNESNIIIQKIANVLQENIN